MRTGSRDEQQYLADVGRIADALERIAGALERTGEAAGLPEPPAHLALAWERFQRGEHIEPHQRTMLDDWRDECARAAGF